jgi:TRAP-type C4-dicarboxylate transport system permease small subunit
MTDSPDTGTGAAPEGSGSAPVGPTIEELQQRYGGPVFRWLRLVHTPLHVAAGVTIIALLAYTVADIIGRTFFASPMRGTVELTELAVVVLVYLGLSHAESRDAHIAVDLLYVKVGVRARLALRVFAGLVTVTVIAVMTWRLYVYAGQLDAGGFTTGILRVPLYPVALVATLGAATFGLAALANTVVSFLAMIRKALTWPPS